VAVVKTAAHGLPPSYAAFRKKYRQEGSYLSHAAAACIEYATEYLKLNEDDSFYDVKNVRWGESPYDMAFDRADVLTLGLIAQAPKKIHLKIKGDMHKWHGDYIKWLKEMS
jgi:hypothetical protein